MDLLKKFQLDLRRAYARREFHQHWPYQTTEYGKYVNFEYLKQILTKSGDDIDDYKRCKAVQWLSQNKIKIRNNEILQRGLIEHGVIWIVVKLLADSQDKISEHAEYFLQNLLCNSIFLNKCIEYDTKSFVKCMKSLPISKVTNWPVEITGESIGNIIHCSKIQGYLRQNISEFSSWLSGIWMNRYHYIVSEILYHIILYGSEAGDLTLIFAIEEESEIIGKRLPRIQVKKVHYMLYILLFFESHNQSRLGYLWDPSNPLRVLGNGHRNVTFEMREDLDSNNESQKVRIDFAGFLKNFNNVYQYVTDGMSYDKYGTKQLALTSAMYILCLLAGVKNIREYMYKQHSDIMVLVWGLWEKENKYSSISSYILAKLILNEDFRLLLRRQFQVISKLLNRFISNEIDDNGCERNYILYVLIQIWNYPNETSADNDIKAKVGTYVIQNLDKFSDQGMKDALYLLSLLYTEPKFKETLRSAINVIIEMGDETPYRREFFNLFKAIFLYFQKSEDIFSFLRETTRNDKLLYLPHSQIERFFILICDAWDQAKCTFDEEKKTLIENIVVVGGFFLATSGYSYKEEVSHLEKELFKFLVNMNDFESNLPPDQIRLFFHQHMEVNAVINPYMKNLLRTDTGDMPVFMNKLYCLLMIDLFYDPQEESGRFYQNDSASWFFKDMGKEWFLNIMLGQNSSLTYAEFFENFETFVDRYIVEMNNLLTRRLNKEQIITNLKQKMAAIFQSHCRTAKLSILELFNVLNKPYLRELSSEVSQISEEVVQDLLVLEDVLNKLETCFVESLSPNLFQNLLQQTIRFIATKSESLNKMPIGKRISLVSAFYNIIKIYENTDQSECLKKPYTQLYIYLLLSMSVEEGEQRQEQLKQILPLLPPGVNRGKFAEYAGDAFTGLQSIWPDIVGLFPSASDVKVPPPGYYPREDGYRSFDPPKPSAPPAPFDPFAPSAPPAPPADCSDVPSHVGSKPPPPYNPDTSTSVARQAEVGRGSRDPALKPPREGPPHRRTGLGPRIGSFCPPKSPGSIGGLAAAVMNRP